MNKIKTTCDGLKYSFHVIFHPFDGFWDLKHEKRGNLYSALAILAMLLVVYILKFQATGFILNYTDINQSNLLIELSGVLMPFILWCISNWCITTLMDGKGTFTDIFITSAYALVPLIFINAFLIMISHFITMDEVSLYTLLQSIAIIWAALLLFVGIMTVHQFSISKTLATCIIAVVGMGVIIFLGILFLSIIQQLINFILLIHQEIITRH